MENRLDHLSEFKEVLAKYTISEQSRTILKQTKLVLLVAPTSAGRNTIIKQLMETGEYHFIVSDTTRHPRINDNVLEQNGREYWFRKEEDVLRDLNNGEYLEAEVVHNQQVSGISIRELEKAYQSHKTAITDIDILGTEHIVQAKPDAVAVLVIPPSFEEWQRRIKHRGAMSQDEYIRRMETASRIFTTVLEQPYFKLVLNDEIFNAAAQIEKLVKGKEDGDSQQDYRQLVQALLVQTQELLESL